MYVGVSFVICISQNLLWRNARKFTSHCLLLYSHPAHLFLFFVTSPIATRDITYLPKFVMGNTHGWVHPSR